MAPDPPRLLPFVTEADWRASLPEVVAHLRADGLIAYPTETVYGFGCGLRPAALARLARVKRRDPDKPFLLLVEGAAQAAELGWTPVARSLASAFWPGPLTLVLRAATGARLGGVALPPEVVGPDGGVAVRATPHPGVRALLAALAGPVTSTSANAPGAPPATDAAAARAAADAVTAGEAESFLVLDGGALAPSAPSTVVSCVDGGARVLRQGALPLAALHRVVPEVHD